MFSKIVLFLIVIAIAVVCYFYGQNVVMKDQMSMFDGLRNTSAIIFGVMGAWLAILHPESLKKVFGKEKGRISKEDRETITLFLSPILISTFILSVVLIVPLFIAGGKTVSSLIQYSEILRGLSFSMLGCLTVLQLWTLILTLVPGDILKRVIQRDEARQKVRDGMFSGTRRAKK